MTTPLLLRIEKAIQTFDTTHLAPAPRQIVEQAKQSWSTVSRKTWKETLRLLQVAYPQSNHDLRVLRLISVVAGVQLNLKNIEDLLAQLEAA
jgi:hypothetical protein